MDSSYPVNLHYYLHDQKTILRFIIHNSGNRITGVEQTFADHLREIQIITDCDPEQPLIPYPDIYKAPETLDLQLFQIIAIESHNRCEIPEYARLVRVLLLEMNRLLNHFNFFVSLAIAVQFPRLLEKSMLNSGLIRKLLLEIDTRLPLNRYFVTGGIAADLPTGFIENLSVALQNIDKSLSYFKRQLTRKTIFSNLLENVGIITPEIAKSGSFSGPNFHASVAKSEYSPEINNLFPANLIVESIIINYRKGTPGDAWHRTWLRFLEIDHSVKLIKHITDAILKTDVQLSIQNRFSDWESNAGYDFYGAEGRINGRINKRQHHHYVTGKYKYPVINVLNELDNILKNERVSATPVVLSSLNLNPLKYLLHR